MNNKVIIKSGSISSHIENEEYFPLRVVYDSFIGSLRFVGFYYKDTDFLEFAVDRESGLVRKMQVVICSNFQFLDDEYSPEEADNSMLYLNYAQHTDCSTFRLTVFNNAVQIVISDKTATAFYRCGQVIYGLSSSSELVSVLVTDMSAQDISHIRSELSLGNEQ